MKIQISPNKILQILFISEDGKIAILVCVPEAYYLECDVELEIGLSGKGLVVSVPDLAQVNLQGKIVFPLLQIPIL